MVRSIASQIPWVMVMQPAWHRAVENTAIESRHTAQHKTRI